MKALLKDIREIILQARQRAVRSVNHELTIAYWNIGRRLVEEEQQGSSRATYGKALIEDIATQLTSEFGNGFSANNLWRMRDFFLTFPSLDALSQELSWTHYRTLVKLKDPDQRSFYISEAIKNSWSVRQLQRQINSMLYERLLRSGKC